MKNNKIKTILIILIVLSYLGGFSASFLFYLRDKDIFKLFMPFCIIAVNGICGYILYKKATNSKTEWMLFGLLANWVALFCYWVILPIFRGQS
jgi:hypothetical protein